MLQPIHFWKDLEKIFPKLYGLVALIVNRFLDKRQKHQHRRLINSYRGDYKHFFSKFITVHYKNKKIGVQSFCIWYLVQTYKRSKNNMYNSAGLQQMMRL